MPLAILLGVIAPGAGLLYVGRPKLALLVAALFWSVTVGVPAIVVDIDPLLIIPWTATALIVLVIVSALAGGLFAGTSTKRLHLWWVAGFALLTHVGASQLRTRVVGEHIVSFALVDQTRYVIAKRPASPGDDVAVRRGNEIKIERAPVDDADVIGRAIALK